MTKNDRKQYIKRFFKAWETGTSADIRAAYDTFLSDDCLYENSGIAPLIGKAAILDFVDTAGQSIDVATMQVVVKKWDFASDCVFTERVDYHRNAAGEMTLEPEICGIMIFNDDGKICRWSDYYNPEVMLHGLEESTQS